MKIHTLICVFSMAVTTTSFADNHGADAPQWGMGNPVEIYGCQFKAGVDATNKPSSTPPW